MMLMKSNKSHNFFLLSFAFRVFSHYHLLPLLIRMLTPLTVARKVSNWNKILLNRIVNIFFFFVLFHVIFVTSSCEMWYKVVPSVGWKRKKNALLDVFLRSHCHLICSLVNDNLDDGKFDKLRDLESDLWNGDELWS